MIYLILLYATFSVSTETICSHLLSQVKLQKIGNQLACKTVRAHIIPKRTLIYQLWAPKYGLLKNNPLLHALKEEAHQCAPETRVGALPELHALNPDNLYFVHVAIPHLEWPHYYAFDSKKDIEKIVNAADPAKQDSEFQIAGTATLGTFNSQTFPLRKKSYTMNTSYQYFNAKSAEARIYWYAIERFRIKEGK